MKWLRASHSKPRWPTIQTPSDSQLASLAIRLLWMLGIWTASVLVLLLIAYGLRWVIAP